MHNFFLGTKRSPSKPGMIPCSCKVPTVVVNFSLMLHGFWTIGSCKRFWIWSHVTWIAYIVLAFKNGEGTCVSWKQLFTWWLNAHIPSRSGPLCLRGLPVLLFLLLIRQQIKISRPGSLNWLSTQTSRWRDYRHSCCWWSGPYGWKGTKEFSNKRSWQQMFSSLCLEIMCGHGSLLGRSI